MMTDQLHRAEDPGGGNTPCKNICRALCRPRQNGGQYRSSKGKEETKKWPRIGEEVSFFFPPPASLYTILLSIIPFSKDSPEHCHHGMGDYLFIQVSQC